MAIDEAILEAHLKGLVPPTLRFYGWQPEAVSIGYAQRIDRQQQERISSHGFGIVRRPTGGRAVLHSGDLTYSFIGTSAFLDENVTRAYKQISQALIKGLAHLGVEASLGGTDTNYRDIHDCFLAVTGADLQVNGKKLVGSAQLRRHHGVLQHGSILLQQDQNLMARLFSKEAEGAKEPIESNYQRHANLYDLIGQRSIADIESALTEGFEEAFAETFTTGELSATELFSARSAGARFAPQT
jgi:lipoyl(octanoyl) transferase